MRLKIIDITKEAKKPKATIHLTGKLGFNSDAADVMKLDDSPAYKLAMNDGDPEDEDLYLIPCERAADPLCLEARKAGEYYYLSLKNVFDNLGIDYENQKVIYDIEEQTYEGDTIYALRKRVKERN